MADRSDPSKFLDLVTLITIGLAVVVVGALVLEVRGPRLDIWAITIYAVFLGTYIGWILGYEYVSFDGLHRLKSQPLDTVLVATILFAILQVSRTAGTFGLSLIWLGVHALALVMWECYTMMRGYDRYFGMRSDGGTLTILSLVRRPVDEVPKSDRRWHWKEYRYWILLDSTVCLCIGVAWVFRAALAQALPNGKTNYVIFAAGFSIGLVNIFRYRRTVRMIREQAGVALIQTS